MFIDVDTFNPHNQDWFFLKNGFIPNILIVIILQSGLWDTIIIVLWEPNNTVLLLQLTTDKMLVKVNIFIFIFLSTNFVVDSYHKYHKWYTHTHTQIQIQKQI